MTLPDDFIYLLIPCCTIALIVAGLVIVALMRSSQISQEEEVDKYTYWRKDNKK